MRDKTEGKLKSNQIDSRTSSELGEVVRNGTFTFIDEYNRQYSILIRNMEQQAAHIQSLAAAHQRQADLYLAYSDRANRAGNAALRDIYAEAARGAAFRAYDLSVTKGGATEILNSYYARASSEYAALLSTNPALRFAAKYGGYAGDVVDISMATLFGTSGDVAKAVVGVALGTAFATLGAAFAASLGFVGLPAAAAAALIYLAIQKAADELIPQEWWDKLGEGSKELFRDLFDRTRRFTPRIDPLVLDLDGDGIETVAAGKHILFDHDGDGVKHASGWVKPDDGFLVLDRNGNGRIDDGSELFGADTVLSNGQKATSGFEALRDLDSNGDGVFDAADTRFADVRVWRDLNQDGLSQDNELFTLSSLGIASITLTPTDTQDLDLGNGNLIDNRGTYTRTNGTTGLVGDLQLGLNHFYRDYSGAHDQVTVTDAAAVLPHLTGSGAVRDLQEAASLSPALLTALQALLSGPAQGTLRAALDLVMALWADTSAMPSTEQRLETSGPVPRTVYYHGAVPASVTAQGPQAVLAWTQQQHARLGPIIAILEKFNGSSLVSDQNGQISTGGQFFTWNRVVHPNGHREEVMRILLQPEQIDDLMKAYDSLKESAYARLILGPRISDYLSGIIATENNGALGWDASWLQAKLDHTWQHNKAQSLQDVMDLYSYGSDAVAGSGWDPLDALRDMIDRTAATADGMQALADAGISLVSGEAEGSAAADMMFGDAGANILRGGAGDDVLSGGAGDDTLYGGDGNDILRGDAGNDTLYGGEGNDLLLGGDGDDVLDGGGGSNRLEGGAGNDVLKVAWYANNNVLIGGTGDDMLYGSYYADTYLFNKGDGHDTIVEQGGSDKIVFGEGLHREEALFRRSGDDLSILFNHSDDQVTVADWFRGSAHQVESFAFQDGTVVSSEVERLIAAMAMTSAVTATQATVRDTNEHHVLAVSSIV